MGTVEWFTGAGTVDSTNNLISLSAIFMIPWMLIGMRLAVIPTRLKDLIRGLSNHT